MYFTPPESLPGIVERISEVAKLWPDEPWTQSKFQAFGGWFGDSTKPVADAPFGLVIAGADSALPASAEATIRWYVDRLGIPLDERRQDEVLGVLRAFGDWHRAAVGRVYDRLRQLAEQRRWTGSAQAFLCEDGRLHLLAPGASVEAAESLRKAESALRDAQATRASFRAAAEPQTQAPRRLK